MDNKVNKRRLSNFLAYEWILVVVAVIAAIFVLEIIYSATGQGLTVGQKFNYYYDTMLQRNDMIDFHSSLKSPDGTNNNVFSYDVIECEYEKIYQDNDVLYARYEIQEVDAIFTDFTPAATPEQSVRLKTLVDHYDIYDLQSLFNDASDYLAQFLKEEHANKTVEQKRAVIINEGYLALDEDKIASHFRFRMKKDNRYRKEAKILEGILLEKGRIEKLCREVKDFYTILTCGQDIFYTYTRYQQAYDLEEFNGNTEMSQHYKGLLDSEKAAGRENLIYGIKLENLIPGDSEENVSKYFRLYKESTAKNVALCVFNQRANQPYLQFETISFVNNVIRQFSDII
ncbi:MAG: hypothetical protein IJZ73_03085 [Clostridia bacterium]|nr:hypothetical protein [Clostridia bacterium]